MRVSIQPGVLVSDRFCSLVFGRILDGAFLAEYPQVAGGLPPSSRRSDRTTITETQLELT